MRFRQIEVFHAVYTTGSISAAARVLHVSQPSVSKVLHHTEQQLGLALFRLVRGRLVATDEAHALFVEASEVFKRLTSLQKTADNLRDQADGRIRLAVVPSLGLHIAPLAIARFRERHPDTTFVVKTLHHDELFEALHERTCDIAIAYETTRREADDEGKPFDHHLSHLAVHGFLHLIGYDHETDTDAEEMENLERRILAQLGIPDPYADRERVT